MAQISLSRLEYDICWESLGLGEFPTVLQMNSHGFTMDERRQLARQAWDTLDQRGLLDRPGELHPDLHDSLETLARPEWEVDARIRFQDRPMVRALAARSGDFAVRAVLGPETLVLERIPPSSLASSMVDLAPHYPAGRGASVTMPASALDQAMAASGEDPRRFRDALTAQGLSTSDADRIAGMVGDVVRMGQFGAARTPRQQVLTVRRQRAGHAVTFYDTSGGRFQFSRKPSADGQEWSTLAPADNRVLRTEVQALLTELSD